MLNEEIFITESFDETRKLGEGLAKKIKNGDILAFYGNLGSGKTTFMQGLAKGLGVKRRIISPTFIIVRSYELQKGNLYHIDLYRTQNVDDLSGLGMGEIIKDRKNIVAIEWAEKMNNFLPQKRIDINFINLGEDKRQIIISRHE
jgi:tRNA threonylcarbamoyladenosine biosynthesis protein TsaE